MPAAGMDRTAEATIKVFGPAITHLLYGVHVGTSYLLMLAAMTFNIGVFLAVCVGTIPKPMPFT